MIKRDVLKQYCHDLLNVDSIKDYCPNGLQVQGRDEIHKIVTGVTASLALIEAAIQERADAILVHHGYFWRNDDPSLVGQQYRRIRLLIENGINCFAYHLPLDAHPELGNNATLAKQLGIQVEGIIAPTQQSPEILFYGKLNQAASANDFAEHLQHQLGRTPLMITAPNDHPIQHIAWCTGGAQSYFDAAISLGVDAYLTGEVSEKSYHVAKEANVHFISAGHHATERYGVQALGKHLAEKFKVESVYIELDNPV